MSDGHDYDARMACVRCGAKKAIIKRHGWKCTPILTDDLIALARKNNKLKASSDVCHASSNVQVKREYPLLNGKCLIMVIRIALPISLIIFAALVAYLMKCARIENTNAIVVNRVPFRVDTSDDPMWPRRCEYYIFPSMSEALAAINHKSMKNFINGYCIREFTKADENTLTSSYTRILLHDTGGDDEQYSADLIKYAHGLMPGQIINKGDIICIAQRNVTNDFLHWINRDRMLGR